MGIEQSRNDEFAAEVEHLRARRRGGVRGKQVANGVPLDQQRAIAKRRVGDTVDDRRASDEERRRRLRLAICQCGKRENCDDKKAEKNASDAHLGPPLSNSCRWGSTVSGWPIGLLFRLDKEIIASL